MAVVHRIFQSLHNAVDILAPVLIPHKLLDLRVVYRPVRRSRGLGGRLVWQLVLLLLLLAQQLSDCRDIVGDCS